MNIVLIGLGQMGGHYLDILVNRLGIEQSSIIGVDVNPEKTAAAQAKFSGVAFYNDLDGVPLGSAQAAIIATNTPNHHRTIITLVEGGIRYLFCEKPLAINLAASQAVGHVIQKSGVQIFTYVAFLMNFSPAMQQLQQLMQGQDLILTEGSVTWGKNRFRDLRPTPGDLEDELVHGAGMLHNLAAINQAIEEIRVNGQLTYQNYIDQVAQDRAYQLDPSFPLKPNSSAMVMEQIQTDRGTISCVLHSSFIGAQQTRRVTGVLSHKDDPAAPVYSFEMNCDLKKKFEADGRPIGYDSLVLTRLDGNKVETFDLPCDKLTAQTAAFLAVVNGGEADSRLTAYDEARQAVAYTEAVIQSHQTGLWVSAFNEADILAFQQRA